MDAVDTFFMMIRKEMNIFKKEKMLWKVLKRPGEEIMKLDLKDWDPVKELRKARDERASRTSKEMGSGIIWKIL